MGVWPIVSVKAALAADHEIFQITLRDGERIGGVDGEVGKDWEVTDKQAVIDALGRLPEGASLEEITEELQIMASIRRGRSDIAAGRSKSHEDVEQLMDSWATAWTSR